MRIILMGTGPFAVPAFEAIRNSEDTIVAVITKPLPTDKKTPIHPVAQWATTACLPIHTPPDLRVAEALELLRSFNADLSVVCDYGQILKIDALEAARLGAINLHGSLLPSHRGAAPVQWSILVGDRTSGVSVIRMTTGLDSGPVLAGAQTDIDPHEDAAQLESRLSQLGVDATLRAIDLLRPCKTLDDVKLLGQKQDAARATKAPRFNKSDGQLDFRWSADVLDRVIRALQPWPGAFAELKLPNGNALRVQIKKAEPIAASSAYRSLGIASGTLSTWSNILASSGTGLDSADDMHRKLNAQDLVVTTGDGILRIHQIQPAGKRLMASSEFAAGYCRSVTLSFIVPTATTLIV
jgi:methionyl-tRNA formyltransferase